MTISRLINVEEHIIFPDIAQKVSELDWSLPKHPDPDLQVFLGSYFGGFSGWETVVGRRLERMDATGVDMQVISHGHGAPGTLANAEAVKLCRTVNDRTAEQIQLAPDRFVGFATLPLIDPEAAANELQRAVEEKGLVGWLQMGTCKGLFLDSPVFRPALKKAADLGIPVYIPRPDHRGGGG